MDGKHHTKAFKYALYFFIPAFIILGILVSVDWLWFIPLLFMSNQMVDPDEDTKWKKGFSHRHYLTHSAAYTLLITGALMCTLIPYMEIMNLIDWAAHIIAVFTIPLILHLSLDIPAKGKRCGTYCIWFRRGKRLSGPGTVWWLVLNILAMIVFNVLMVIFL